MVERRTQVGKPHKARPNEMKEWDLILATCHYSMEVTNLTPAQYEELYALVWSCTDAYGPKGWLPPQGYDWSGIRDSSAAAHRDMYSTIVNYFYVLGKEFIEYQDRK